MWTGRRRHFLNPEKSAHKAFNAIIQGGAFEIVKDAMIRLDETVCSDKCKMVLQVHDSVWFEIATGYNFDQQIIKAMTDIPQDFGVPFVVEKKVLNGIE
jgi:DNA polymerase I-like protein with 3'-5' exonuclease and polymerase domains